MLTGFIIRGEAYASRLTGSNGRAVILVLIAMQKLASSSVAAIRRALKRRLDGIVKAKAALAAAQGRRLQASRQTSIAEYEESDASGDLDRMSRLEEELPAEWSGLHLMLDEEPRLRELIAAAEAVV